MRHNNPITFNDPSGADPPQTINYSATVTRYYTSYTYDDRLDYMPMGDFICGQCWRLNSPQAMKLYLAATGYGNAMFGMGHGWRPGQNSLNAAAFAYFDAIYNYRNGMKSDADAVNNGTMSHQEYGMKYGSAPTPSIGAALLASGLGDYHNGAFGFWMRVNNDDPTQIIVHERFVKIGRSKFLMALQQQQTQNGPDPSNSSLYLYFNGSELHIIKDGVSVYGVSAVSGRPQADGSFDYSVANQKNKSVGPIPAGTYSVNPANIQKQGMSDYFIGLWVNGVTQSIFGTKTGA